MTVRRIISKICRFIEIMVLNDNWINLFIFEEI